VGEQVAAVQEIVYAPVEEVVGDTVIGAGAPGGCIVPEQTFPPLQTSPEVHASPSSQAVPAGA
jgi:hypothetical protein